MGEDSGIPLYFETLNGSIKDVSTLENMLKMMKWLNARRLRMVMDRGFYSERNVDDLYKKHVRFIVGVPFTTKWAHELVDSVRNSIEHYSNFHRLGEQTFFADTNATSWKEHRCYRHIYYNSQKAAADYAEFLESIEQWRSELENHKEVEAHQTYYKRYFIVRDTPKRGRRILVRDEAVQSFKQNTAGYCILLSNDIKDPVQALKIYRDKDRVEKGFDNLKNALDMNRLRIQSAAAMQGRLFVQFVAQILVSAIHNSMAASKLDESYSLPELINELKSIHSVRLDNRRKPFTTKLSKSQVEILSAFGLQGDSYV
jgi:transposase